MDYTPYEESLAAINGLPVDLESKPATDFATYIQTLLDNPAPRGFMLSGRAPANAEEELELKKAEEAIKKLVPASMFAGEGDGPAPANNDTGFSMGIGNATDAIVADTIQSAIQGALTGGLVSAGVNAIQTYALGMLGLQHQINNTPDGDVLGAWAQAQMGYPAPTVDLSTPSTMFSGSIADGGYQGPMSFSDGTIGGVTVGDPMDSSVPTATPIGPPSVTVGGPMTAEVDFSIEDSGGGTSVSPTSEAASGSGMGPDGASSSGGDSGGGCCFIMLEARYGDGTMDSVVRKYRDEMMTDKNRRGYYKLAEVFVPLMRKSKVFKFLVKKTFADPLVSYGQWHYKENKHGWLFAPLKNLWMKVFNILGSDTQFIRENGEVV